MPTATLHPAKSHAPLPRGGQPGNKNRANDHAPTFLHVRCHPADKGAWTRAANLAVKNKLMEADKRGNLASWVVKTLNAAADAQLGERVAALRIARGGTIYAAPAIK